MKRDQNVVDATKYLDRVLESVTEQSKGAGREELMGLAWASLHPDIKQWVRGQILRCRKDPRWLFGNYFWIQHPRSGDPTTLDLNDAQELVMETIEYLWTSGRPGWLLIHKARQMGISTFAIAMLVYRVCFHSQVMALIVAHDEGHSTYELSMFQWFLANMPWWLQPNIARQHIESRMVMGVQNDTGYGGLNSWIIAASCKKMSAFAQGKPFSDLHITETGGWPDAVAQKIIDQDLSQMVSRPGCVAINESKPYGASGWWYKTWHHYEKLGRNGLWHSMFLPCFMERSRTTIVPAGFKPTKDETKIRERYWLEWRKCECGATFYSGGSSTATCQRCDREGGSGIMLTDGQLGWYRMKKSQVRDEESLQNFLQEFAMTAEEGFQVHGKTVFPRDVYRYVSSTAIDPVWLGEFRSDFTFHSKGKRCANPECNVNHDEDEMPLKVWEMPRRGTQYYIGADAAYGEDEGDFGVISVHRCGRGHEEPDEQVAEWRGRCDAGVLGTNIYILARIYNECQVAVEVRNGPGEKAQLKLKMMGYDNLYRWKHYDSIHMVSGKQGWVTNARTKPMLITTFIEWCRQKLIVIKSKDFLAEMPSFIKRADYDESGEAASGKHDDCVPEGTLIQTDKGVKPIEEIQVGELVLTHKGRFMPVEAVGNRYEPERLFEVKATGRPSLYLTAEHPVLLWKRKKKTCLPGERFDVEISGKRTWKKVGPTKRICHIYWADEAWEPFENLKDWKLRATGSLAPSEVRDIGFIDISLTMPDNYKVIDGKMVGFRRRNPCILPRQNNMAPEIPLGKELLRLMGYYLAEGTRGLHTLGFASHAREVKITQYMANFLRSLGLNPLVRKVSNQGSYLSLSSIPLHSFFKQFGKSDGKKLPDWCLLLPPEKQKQILIGYLLGDGSFRRSNGSIGANTISPQAGYQIFNMSLRCGWLCSMGYHKGQNGYKPQISLSWDPWESDKIKACIEPEFLQEKRPFSRKEINRKACAPMRKLETGQMVGRIRKVKEIPFCGTVYNLTVAEDHSFVANGTIISNSIIANMLALHCHHDEDYDPEKGRILIPHERLRLPDPNLPGCGLYVMTCNSDHHHVTTASQPHGWICPECKKLDDKAKVPAASATRARGQTAMMTVDPLAPPVMRVDPNQFMHQLDQVEIQ